MATSEAVAAITLRGGLIAPLPALMLLWNLETRGFDLRRAGDKLRVHPLDQLTAEDSAAIRQWRSELLALVDYCGRPPWMLDTSWMLRPCECLRPIDGATHRTCAPRTHEAPDP